MQERLFTFVLCSLFLLPLSSAQQRGEILNVLPVFDLSVQETEDAINSAVPIGIPEWILNLLTNIDYPIQGFRVTYGTVDFDDNPTFCDWSGSSASEYLLAGYDALLPRNGL